MIYGEPWLYGTVRAGRTASAQHHLAHLAHQHGAPVLLVCSCPDFLGGTARDLGSNCRKCGGHRLAGLAIGGTCRVPTTTVRARPSLAGMLKPTVEDPYDLMRRNRLLEPRSRARSISPLRGQASQRDARSQSVVRCGPVKVATVEPMSRSEWFDCGPAPGPTPGSERLLEGNVGQPESPGCEWTTGTSTATVSRRGKPRVWSSEEPDGAAVTSAGDSRRSILECDVNPYLLLKSRQQRTVGSPKDEDELSDELSDNALEAEPRHASSTLFDPSKVKSIERIPSRGSVAAIGGQRIRVFNEPVREPSDEEEAPAGPGLQAALTRIPIPKISPKRPPRRPKEARPAPRSILKRAEPAPGAEGKRKSVLFNVDNVILAPEKPADACPPAPRKTSRSPEAEAPPPPEAPIIPEEVPLERPHRFITVPNIRGYGNRGQRLVPEAKIVPRVKNAPPPDRIKIDKFVPSKKQQLTEQHHQLNRHEQTRSVPEDQEEEAADPPAEKPAEEPSPVEVEDADKPIAVEEKTIDEIAGAPVSAESAAPQPKPTPSCLTRSQSERSSARPAMSAGDVHFVDTMRLSLCRRGKDEEQSAVEVARLRKLGFEEAKRRLAVKRELKMLESGLIGARIEEEEAAETDEQFRRMRPTSWSPPPTELKQPRDDANVCKITVAPKATPASLMVHRLQVGATTPTPRGTSIIINGGQQPPPREPSLDSGNKVTISVGGENSRCNPTVISVNGSASDAPSTASDQQRRTLVILDNYRSNIVIGGESAEVASPQEAEAPETRPQTRQSRPIEIKPRLKFKEADESPDSSPRWRQIVEEPEESSKEELISKLLEDSLRKARENGEILDEGSGEAILKILKQSLLKGSGAAREPEASYYRSPFLEENAYEVIKEPIYEEIPDEPPPLPLSPPPTEDFLKGRIFFGDEYKDGYRDLTGSVIGTPLDGYYKPLGGSSNQYLECSYLSKSPEVTFDKPPSSVAEKDNLSSKFELLNFIMDSKERTLAGHVALDQEEEEEEEELADEEEEEEEEDAERDLEALYEQKETSLGDLSSKSSQISNVSDSSEECNIILANSPEALKARTVEIERTDSGVGSESSQASSGRGGGAAARRWRAPGPAPPPCTSAMGTTSTAGPAASPIPASPQGPAKPADLRHCEDCEQRIEPLIIDSGCLYSPVVCRKCGKKRAERKEIVTEIVETEQKYGRDLQIILDEFHRPMLRAGLLTQDQLAAIFLNVEELLEHNQILAEKLKDAVDIAQESGDDDLVSVDLGKIFLESERMLHAFEAYCTRQGGASLLLQNLEKEKELLRIFLKVSQMENTVLRRMNLNSFLMVPVQRVTKYPLLLARLLKATPSGRPEMQELKKRLKQAQTNIELHLEHMNAEAKDITSTKLWRRISIIQNGRRSTGEQDMVNIKLRKMAVEVLEWAHEDSRFVLEGRLLVAQPTDNNWRRGRTVKLAPVTAMLVTNGKPNAEFLDFSDDSLFPRQIGIKDATLLLVKEKLGRYSLLREPLYLDKCIVCCETDLEDYFEVQELSSKETFIFKAEDGARTKRWCRTLQAHAQSLGAWRRRRGALPNIMICGVARN